MSILYSIRDWNEHFEVSQTRKVENVRWVPVPVRHDGLRFRRLMAMPAGLEVFGAWVLILQVAGKCKVRGTLATDSGEPLTASDLAAMTGTTEKQMKQALQVLTSSPIKWVLESESNRMESESNQMQLQDSRGEENRGEEGSSEPPAASEPPVMVFQTVGESHEWSLTTGHVTNLVEAFPALDVLAECRQARQWCESNPRNRKTPRGMSKFLFGWMSRAQNSGKGAKAEPQKQRVLTTEELSQWSQK